MKVTCPNPKCGAVNDDVESGGLCGQCFEELPSPSPATRGRAGPSQAVPECYACSAQATTRCQSCGTPSCVLHLRHIFIDNHATPGGGTNELRCESCYSSAMRWKVVTAVCLLAAAVAIAIYAAKTVLRG